MSLWSDSRRRCSTTYAPGVVAAYFDVHESIENCVRAYHQGTPAHAAEIARTPGLVLRIEKNAAQGTRERGSSLDTRRGPRQGVM